MNSIKGLAGLGLRLRLGSTILITVTHQPLDSTNSYEGPALVAYPSIKTAGNRPPAVPSERFTNRHPIGTIPTAYQTDISYDRNTTDTNTNQK